MIKYILILILLFPTISEAGISVCSDVNDKIIKFQLRGGQLTDCLWFDAGQNISQAEDDRIRGLLKTQPRKYLKVVSGTIQEMTITEKAQADADEALAASIVEGTMVNRLEVSNEEIIMALVQTINKRLPTNKITKQEIIDQIKVNKGL